MVKISVVFFVSHPGFFSTDMDFVVCNCTARTGLFPEKVFTKDMVVL